MKTVIIYYSNNGSNRYLARQLSDRIPSEMEAIRPVINVHILMLMGIGLGIRRIRHPLSEYDRVILVGPIWMGKFVYPLRRFVKRYRKLIDNLVFVTCCGSSYEMRDKKFGHGLVFNKVKELLPGKEVQCAAFPITLTLPEDKKEDPQLVMSTRLSEENFTGEIRERFEAFMKTLENHR